MLMRRLLSRESLTAVCLVIACAATLLLHDRPLVRGDGLAYLVWLDSMALDGDIDLSNQFHKFSAVIDYQIIYYDKTGRYANAFPYGAALLQLPFYLLGDFFYQRGWWTQNPAYFLQMQGAAQSYSLWLMIGANLMTMAAVLIAWRLGRRLTDNATAAIAAYAFMIGTPLLYYSATTPLNSHNPGAFLCTCALWLLFHCLGSFRPLSEASQPPSRPTKPLLWMLLGICAGLMAQTRYQLILIALPAWALLAWRRQWRGLLISGAAALIALLPLSLSWIYLFGEPIVVPHDILHSETFMTAPLYLGDVLAMLIAFSPIVLLSFLGLWALWRVDPALALCFFVIIALQILVNGSNRDWHGSDGYKLRRMTELYPIYVVLACATFGRWRELCRPKLAALRWMLSRAFLVICIPLAFIWLHAFYVYTWADGGRPAGAPGQMIQYALEHPHRSILWREILDAHVGPAAFPKPGP